MRLAILATAILISRSPHRRGPRQQVSRPRQGEDRMQLKAPVSLVEKQEGIDQPEVTRWIIEPSGAYKVYRFRTHAKDPKPEEGVLLRQGQLSEDDLKRFGSRLRSGPRARHSPSSTTRRRTRFAPRSGPSCPTGSSPSMPAAGTRPVPPRARRRRSSPTRRAGPARGAGRARGSRAAGARRGRGGRGRRSPAARAPRRRARSPARRLPRASRGRRRPRSEGPSSSPSSPAVQGRSQEPPGKTSGLGAITRAPGASVARSGASGAGRSRSASCSRSSAWIASSVPAYSPSPKWNQRSAPPQAPEEEAGPALAAVGRARARGRRRSRPGTRPRAARGPRRPPRGRRRTGSGAPGRRSSAARPRGSGGPTRAGRGGSGRC